MELVKVGVVEGVRGEVGEVVFVLVVTTEVDGVVLVFEEVLTAGVDVVVYPRLKATSKATGSAPFVDMGCLS